MIALVFLLLPLWFAHVVDTSVNCTPLPLDSADRVYCQQQGYPKARL